MLKGHFLSAGAAIEYGEATSLFPIEDLDAILYQYRDAELALDDVTGDDVIVITPTSLATGYALGHHPLTAIVVDSLPAAVKTQLDDAIAHRSTRSNLFRSANGPRIARTTPSPSSAAPEVHRMTNTLSEEYPEAEPYIRDAVAVTLIR